MVTQPWRIMRHIAVYFETLNGSTATLELVIVLVQAAYCCPTRSPPFSMLVMVSNSTLTPTSCMFFFFFFDVLDVLSYSVHLPRGTLARSSKGYFDCHPLSLEVPSLLLQHYSSKILHTL
jgi:hypothetical protein